MTVETPETLAAGTVLLKRFARLAGKLQSIVGTRDAAIAAANVAADKQALPIAKDLAEIITALEPWWKIYGIELTKGKRKSVELGGCVIGTKAAAAKLVVADDDDDAAVARLRPLRWAVALLKTKVTLDRKAIMTALGGRNAKKLKDLGLTPSEAGDVFFVNPVGQAGAAIEAKA